MTPDNLRDLLVLLQMILALLGAILAVHIVLLVNQTRARNVETQEKLSVLYERLREHHAQLITAAATLIEPEDQDRIN